MIERQTNRASVNYSETFHERIVFHEHLWESGLSSPLTLTPNLPGTSGLGVGIQTDWQKEHYGEWHFATGAGPVFGIEVGDVAEQTETATITLQEFVQYDPTNNELHYVVKYQANSEGTAGLLNVSVTVNGVTLTASKPMFTDLTPGEYYDFNVSSGIGVAFQCNSLHTGDPEANIARISCESPCGSIPYKYDEQGNLIIVDGSPVPEDDPVLTNFYGTPTPQTFTRYGVVADFNGVDLAYKFVSDDTSTQVVLLPPSVTEGNISISASDNRTTTPKTTINLSGTIYSAGEPLKSEGSYGVNSLKGVSGALVKFTGQDYNESETTNESGGFSCSKNLYCHYRYTTSYSDTPYNTGNWDITTPITVGLDSDWCVSNGQYYVSQESSIDGTRALVHPDSTMLITDPCGELPEWEVASLQLKQTWDLGLKESTWSGTGVTITDTTDGKKLESTGGTKATCSIAELSSLGITLGYHFYQFKVKAISGDTFTVKLTGFTQQPRDGSTPSWPWKFKENISASEEFNIGLSLNSIDSFPRVKVVQSGDWYLVRLYANSAFDKITSVEFGGLTSGHSYEIAEFAAIVPCVNGTQEFNGAGTLTTLESSIWPSPDESSMFYLWVRDNVAEGPPAAMTGHLVGKPLGYMSFYGLSWNHLYWYSETEEEGSGAIASIGEVLDELKRWISVPGSSSESQYTGGLQLTLGSVPESGETAIRTNGRTCHWIVEDLCVDLAEPNSARILARPKFPKVYIYAGGTFDFSSIRKVLGGVIECYVQDNNTTMPANLVQVKARKNGASSDTNSAGTGYPGVAVVGGLKPSSYMQGVPTAHGNQDGVDWTVENGLLSIDSRYILSAWYNGSKLTEASGYLVPPRTYQFTSITVNYPVVTHEGRESCLEINAEGWKFLFYEDGDTIRVKRQLGGSLTWENTVSWTGKAPWAYYQGTNRLGTIWAYYSNNGTIYELKSINQGKSFGAVTNIATGNYPTVKVDRITGIKFVTYWRETNSTEHTGTFFMKRLRSDGTEVGNEIEVKPSGATLAVPASRFCFDFAKDRAHSIIATYTDSNGGVHIVSSKDNGKSWG